MDTQHFAITSVPVQSWKNHLYEYEKALQIGTIFPELDMPFFAAKHVEEKENLTAKEGPADPIQYEREKLMTKIYETSFALDDLVLFIDTHPDCKEAAALRRELIKERKRLLKEHDQKYYPLTKDCEGLWTEGSMPWEGACV